MTSRLTDLLSNRLGRLALLFLFALPALSPLFSPTPTRSADGLLHLYRLVQLDALWRNGIFFSRWLPDLAFGYGMPLFNYYAPLVYYITTPLHWLGIPFTLALNLALAAAMFVGAVGMFYFTRAVLRDVEKSDFGNFSALVAALAYLYAPYILYNALHRGNLAEQWALAFAPFALWRFLELTRTPNALNWSLAVLFFAAVMLSHNVTSFLFAPLLFVFTLACVFSNTTRAKNDVSRLTFPVSRFSLLAPLSAFLLALALSSFFWLPALLERDFVQIARVIVTPDFDYRFNFVPFRELISFLPRADTGRLNPSFPATLGVFQILFASGGIIFLFWKFRSRRALPWFTLAFAAFGFIALMLSFSQPIWDSISLWSYVQLPMRLRGLGALCLAPFAGIFVFALPTRWKLLSACVASVAIVLSALPMLYPRYARDVPPNPTLTDMFAYEQKTGAFGTTSFGEYLPVWVQNLPDKSPFAEDYARGENPNRLVIPEGVDVCGAQIQPLVENVCVNSNDSWRAIYRAFYFPGWRVTLDGTPLEITPTPRTGLISFDVPKSGTLSVTYKGTSLEQLADWISTSSAILVFGVFAFGMYKKIQSPISNLQSPISSLQSPSSDFPLLLLVALALIALKLVYIDRVSNPFVAHSDNTQVEGISQTRTARFGDNLQLLGFDVNATDIARGETLRTDLYWRALPELKEDLSVFVHLVAPDGSIVAQKDNLHPANLPTTQWELDAYVADEHALAIPVTLAAGEYELRAGVYDPRTDTRLKTADGADFILLQKIRVK